MAEPAREIAAALARCTFLPASWDKRFCRDMAAITENGRELSERQKMHLLRLAHKYRRQLPTKVIEAALDEMEREANRRVAEGKPALPDFRPAPRERATKDEVAVAPPLQGSFLDG